MPLPIPNLDDRRFDDLVAEATARVEAHTPEWSNIAPGDPGAALIDMFAWLTETILYRQNLIPLRQRRAFMNLLSLPLRPAAPATGVVCVDTGPLPLPKALAAGQAQFKIGGVSFTSTTDLQPTPLQLVPMMKARYQADLKLLNLLRVLYNYEQPVPFVAQPAFGPDGALRLAGAADGQVWLALVRPRNFASSSADLRSALAKLAADGSALSIGLAPVSGVPGYNAFDQATELPGRRLQWAVVSQDESGVVRQVPLEVQADTSKGGRTAGVALLRLPSTPDLLAPPAALNGGDPMFAGTVAMPPELPVDVTPDRVVMWLTLGCADAPDLTLGYLAVNAVAIIAQTTERNEPLGVATGAGDATFTLSGKPVDPASLTIQVWQGSQATIWMPAENFGGAGRNDKVYVLDPSAGTVTFGDGIRGQRPPANAVIVAQSYRWGGGGASNLAAGSIKAIQPTVGTVRHEWPTAGGSDGETVDQAERRIPAFLSHRDRAVTLEDFRSLAFDTPGVILGRAEVVPGLMPGATAELTRLNVPGVVSVFVFPDHPVAFGNGPVAMLAQLQDVFAWLRQRILIGTHLFVLSAEPVPVYASVSIRLLNGADPVATTQAVQNALAQYLWPLPPGGPEHGGWPLGRTVAPDELLTQAARQPGVLAADVVALYSRSATTWTTASSVPLEAWQVPALQGVSVSTDGSAPAEPPAIQIPPADGGSASGPTLVPIVPKLC